jgi:hypothetical protein
MAKRGTLYRCHLFSYGGPQTEGVESFWGRDLRPVGDQTIDSGTWVELFVTIRASELALTAASRIRFDILEEDFILTGGNDDFIASIKGTGAQAGDRDFPKVFERLTVFREVPGGQSVQDAVLRFQCEKPDGYRDHLLILETLQDEPVWHVVTWWKADYDPEIGKSEFYFIVNVDEAFEDQTDSVLYVREASAEAPKDRLAFTLPSCCDTPVERPPLAPNMVPLIPSEPVRDELPGVASLQGQVQRNHRQAPDTFSPNEFGLPPDGKSPFGADDDDVAELAAEDYVTRQCRQSPWPEILLPHPARPVNADSVRDGAGPYDDRLIAVLPDRVYLKTKAHRHAVSYNIVRALQWGWLLFGTRAFVVIEGPLTVSLVTGERDIAYYTIPLDHALEMRQAKGDSGKAKARAGGRDLFGVQVKHWLVEHPGPDKRSAVVRLIGCANQFEMILPFTSWSFYCELEREVSALVPSGDPSGLEIPKERALLEAFSRVKKALAAGNTQDAANELTYLGRVAFRLLEPEDRLAYIILLLDAWTMEAHERAIVEIVRSVKDYDEFKQLVAKITEKDKLQKLIDDLDYKLWDLLQTIGSRFGDQVTWEMNKEFLMTLLEEASGLAGGGFMTLVPKIQVKVEGDRVSVSIDTKLLAELQEAGEALLRFIVTNLEGVWMMLSQPDKLVEGIWQLIKMVVMLYLAGAPFNYPPAQQFVTALMKGIGEQIKATYKGALLLGVGDKVLRRIKWMIVMEVASLLIGVGEIRAALEAASSALRLGDRIAGLARLARVFRTAGEVEGATLRMERLAVLMANEGRVVHASEEGVRLLSALPPEDLTLLEKALQKANLEEVPTASKLAAANPEVAKALEQIEPRLELLQKIESKMVC